MKKSPSIALALSINILFLFLYVHKASQCLQEGYYIQKLHAQHEELTKQKQILLTQLNTKKSQDRIQEFVTHDLQMKPLALTQVQKLSV